MASQIVAGEEMGKNSGKNFLKCGSTSTKKTKKVNANYVKWSFLFMVAPPQCMSIYL